MATKPTNQLPDIIPFGSKPITTVTQKIPVQSTSSSPDVIPFGSKPISQVTSAPVKSKTDDSPLAPLKEAFAVPIETGSNILNDWHQRFSDLLDTVGKSDLNIANPNKNRLEAIESDVGVIPQAVGGTIGAGFDILGEGLKSIVKGISGVMDKPARDILTKSIKDTLETPGIKQGVQALSKGMDVYNQWKKSDPVNARTLEGIANIALLGVGGEVKKAAEPVLDEMASRGEKAIGDVKDILEPVIDKANTTIQAAKDAAGAKSTKDLTNYWEDAFNATKSGANKLDESQAWGKDPSGFLANKKIMPEVVGTKLSTTKAIEQLTADEAGLNKLRAKVLETNPKLISIDDLEKSTLDALNNPANKAKNLVGKLQDAAKAEFEGYRKSYGDNISLKDLQDIKIQKRIQSGIFDSNSPVWTKDVNYQISTAARKAIEDATSGDVNIKALNDYIGQHEDAIAMLEKINGQTIKGGRLGKYVGMMAGEALGKGVIGKIAGITAGNYVADAIMNLSVDNPLRNFLLKYAKESDPEVYKQALEYVKNEEAAKATRLALPEGTKTLPPYVKTETASQKAARLSANDLEQNLKIQKNTIDSVPRLPAYSGNIIYGPPAEFKGMSEKNWEALKTLNQQEQDQLIKNNSNLPSLQEIYEAKNRLYNKYNIKIGGGR